MALRTNEKLYHAQLLIAQAKQASGALQRALLEASVADLALTYRCFLSEVAQALSEKLVADTARQMQQQLQQRQRDASVINELVVLERSGEWPAQLLQAFTATMAQESVPKTASVQEVDPLKLVSVDTDHAEIDVASCQRWLMALQKFVDEQREFLQEW